MKLFLLQSAAPGDGSHWGCGTDPAPSTWRERWRWHGVDLGRRQTLRKGFQLKPLCQVGEPHAAGWSAASVGDPGRTLGLGSGGARGLLPGRVLSRGCWARLLPEKNMGVLFSWEGLLLDLGLGNSHG